MGMRNLIWSKAAEICQVRESFLSLWKILVLIGAGAGVIAASADYLTGKNVMDVRLPAGVIVTGIPRETGLDEVQSLYTVHRLKEIAVDIRKGDYLRFPRVPDTRGVADNTAKPLIVRECRQMRLESGCYEFPMLVFVWYPLVVASFVATIFPLVAELALLCRRFLLSLWGNRRSSLNPVSPKQHKSGWQPVSNQSLHVLK